MSHVLFDYPEPARPLDASTSNLPYFNLNDNGDSNALPPPEIIYERPNFGNFAQYVNGFTRPGPQPGDLNLNELDDDGLNILDGVPFTNPFAQTLTRNDNNIFQLRPNRPDSDADDDGDHSPGPSRPPGIVIPGEVLSDNARGATRGRARGRGRGGRKGGLAELLRRTDPERIAKEARGPPVRGRPRGSGVGRGAGEKRPGRKARKAARTGKGQLEISKEFKDLQARATTAFLDKNYEVAADCAKEAVQINPEIFAAHSLLSQIYYEMGKKEESLGVLWSGAHTQRTAGVWWEVANRTSEMKYQDDEMTQKQMLYCYSQIARLDPDDFDAHKGKLEIYTSMRLYGRSIKECMHMARIRPQDLDVLQNFAEMCIQAEVPKRAKDAYDKAIQYYQEIQNDEHDGDFSYSDLNIYAELLVHVGQWAEGLKAIKSVSRWLCGRRNEAYWNDVPNDCEWDLEDQPRRIYIPDYKPQLHNPAAYGQALLPEIRAKMGIFRLKMGSAHLAEAMQHFELFYPDDDGEEATVYEYTDIFREIADALRSEKHYPEALRFYEPLEKAQVKLDAAAHLAMAECYQKTNQTAKTVVCWEAVAKVDSDNVEVFMGLAKAYEAMGESAKAYENLAKVMRLGRKDVIQSSGLTIQPPVVDRYAVQPVASEAPQGPLVKTASKSASGLAAEVSDDNVIDEDDDEERPESLLVKQKRKPREYKKREPAVSVYKTRIAEQARYLLSLHERNEVLRGLMNAGDVAAEDEWMENAQIMVEAFKSDKLFFPQDRYIKFLGYSAEARRRALKPGERSEVEAMADRLQTTLDAEAPNPGNLNPVDETRFIPTAYHGIEFTAWLDTFCLSGVLAAKSGDGTLAYSILDAAERANVFYHNDAWLSHINVCILSAALALHDEEKLCNTARFFIKQFPYVTDTFRLYAALNRIFPETPSWYNSGPSQKFFMRLQRQMDYAVVAPADRPRFNFPEQVGRACAVEPTSADATPGNPHGLKEIEPVLLMVYGHFLATAASYPNALNYYFRALAADRTCSMAVLSISVCYMQWSMKRQCDNRQFAIVQGVAFFGEYRRLRLIDSEGDGMGKLADVSQEARNAIRAKRIMEVEFNEGRFWHHLGLLHLAVPCYERCLHVDIDVVQQQMREYGDMMDIEGSYHQLQATRNDAHASKIEDDMDLEEADFKREAAYALQQIWALGGDFRKAREVARKWLVF
jgi:general transcription factor 3C polypeptide 3 (transcription factor C subunit 4)